MGTLLSTSARPTPLGTLTLKWNTQPTPKETGDLTSRNVPLPNHSLTTCYSKDQAIRTMPTSSCHYGRLLVLLSIPVLMPLPKPVSVLSWEDSLTLDSVSA